MIKKLLHAGVKALRAEGFIAWLGQSIPAFKKLVPLHSSYKSRTVRKIVREGVVFEVDISDYMQWYLLAHLPDRSWMLAMDHLKPNSFVIDIGANVGHFSIILAGRLTRVPIGIQVLAFEPNPVIFHSLCRNVALNPGVRGILTSVQVALGDREGEMPFIYSMSNSGAGRLTSQDRETTRVRMTTLDSYSREMGITAKISFLKIDVEGFEPEVLRGAQEVLEVSRPVLFIEFTPSWSRERGVDAFEMITKLERINYQLFFEKESEMLPLNRHRTELDSLHQTNILAVPNPK